MTCVASAQGLTGWSCRIFVPQQLASLSLTHITALKSQLLRGSPRVTYTDRLLQIWRRIRANAGLWQSGQSTYTEKVSNLVFYAQSTSAVISGRLTYIEHRKHSGVISSEETFPALMAMSSQNLPFKPCTGCMQWLLTHVSVLFSFFHISLQAYTYKTNTPHVTSFNQQTIRRWDTEAHPNFTDSINSAKQTRNEEFIGQSSIIVKMPAANTHSVLSFRHFNPISDRNLEIHCSKPVTFTIQRSECNWFHLVLRTTYVAIHFLSANDENSTQSGAIPV